MSTTCIQCELPFNVRDMMADCALMVDEQGDMIDRIEDDMELSVIHTTKGVE